MLSVYNNMFRVLLSFAALAGGAITFLGGSAANFNSFSFYGLSGDHLVGSVMLLLGVILVWGSSRS
jgi:hypothetical protein